MFRCAIGHENVGPRITAHKIVTETRQRKYIDGLRESVGWEIVREILACEQHAKQFKPTTTPRR